MLVLRYLHLQILEKNIEGGFSAVDTSRDIKFGATVGKKNGTIYKTPSIFFLNAIWKSAVTIQTEELDLVDVYLQSHSNCLTLRI